ncbi:MAG: alcohol dehydrogenase catalytic domain-containing protein [Clostridia bacterium]|nr:alcohol dehydrogenase catalytic domain-containing protein [Clostridia bacterium]
MKRLTSVGPGKTAMRDAEMPKIEAPNQLIVKMKYCGVCMSEHTDWEQGTAPSFGHEPIGVVYEVGEGVTRFKVGDRVSGLFGGRGEYERAIEERVFIIPDNVKDEEAVLEPLACLISAVSKVKIEAVGDRVAVVGCGYMGCGAISLLKKRGAYVVAVDIRQECLDNAKHYGADEVYLVKDLPKHYKDVPGNDLEFSSQGFGFKTVMEWTETEEGLDLAIQMTRQCGQLAVGAYHTGGKRLVDVQMLNVKAIDCLSTHPREQDLFVTSCANAVRMLGDNSWNFKSVPTKVYPVSMFDQAQGDLKTKYGKYMKALVDFEREDFEPYIID